ncbi:hypothetical protein [Actinomadura macra]|nr:hypothetical protein [Actinomadura macra]
MTAVQNAATMMPLRELAGLFALTLVYGAACAGFGWVVGFVGRG